MKKILLVICFLFSMLHMAVADNFDHSRWRMYLAYHDVTAVASSGHTLYGLYNGNLLSYDLDDATVRFIEKSDGLSEKGIRFMDYSEENGCLVLLYDNNNVDFLYDDGTVVNLPQIKNYTDGDVHPTGMTLNQKWAAISTEEGVIVLNIPSNEVKGYYRLGKDVRKAAVSGNEVYALIGDDLYRCNMHGNIYDFSMWIKVTELPTEDILPYGEGIYQLVASRPGVEMSELGAYYLRAPQGTEKNEAVRVTDIWVVMGAKANGEIYLSSPNHLVHINGSEPEKVQGFVRNVGDFTNMTYSSDGSMWMVDRQNKLLRYHYDAVNNTLQEEESHVGGYGPRRDLCYDLHYTGNRLLVAGGRMDYFNGVQFPPTAMYFDQEQWHFLPETGFTLEGNGWYRNVLSVAQSPTSASDFYVGCMNGLLHFNESGLVEQFHPKNSPLHESKGTEGDPNYVIVDGLCFDPAGNLWMTNYATKKSIHVLKKDGNWTSYAKPDFTNIVTPERLLIAKNGQIWVTSRRTTNGGGTAGLYSLDINGTVDDESDDRSFFRTGAANQDGNMCVFDELNTICEDLNGQIWIGCRNGVFVVNRPDVWFSHDRFRLYQPKVPRNDGTNLADYLLTGINVSAIAVDAGNRKWIGTIGSGIYVVSPDGTEVLEHISMENTPLLSDNILSLAFHTTTGELMIGTDIGLCSYQSHVLPAVSSMDKNTVKVYPNPVRPDFQGNVVIGGLTDGAEVKIVTAGSQLVARGNAVGGSFEWNVCNMMNGRRVASGVYYVLAASVNGGGNVAAKIVVI